MEKINLEEDELEKWLCNYWQISQHMQPLGGLNWVLNTQVDLVIGEVLGISKELPGMLGDKIKPRTNTYSDLGKLEELVTNVPLNYGKLSTKANLHGGSHVPFELLLEYL